MAMFNSHVSLPEGIVFAFFSKATNIGLSENGPSNFHALFIITAIPLLAIGWLHGYIIVFFLPASGHFQLTSCEDSFSILSGTSEGSEGSEVLILDTVEHAKGLEHLFVICVALDAKV
jgi:hypothetical protein